MRLALVVVLCSAGSALAYSEYHAVTGQIVDISNQEGDFRIIVNKGAKHGIQKYWRATLVTEGGDELEGATIQSLRDRETRVWVSRDVTREVLKRCRVKFRPNHGTELDLLWEELDRGGWTCRGKSLRDGKLVAATSEVAVSRKGDRLLVRFMRKGKKRKRWNNEVVLRHQSAWSGERDDSDASLDTFALDAGTLTMKWSDGASDVCRR